MGIKEKMNEKILSKVMGGIDPNVINEVVNKFYVILESSHIQMEDLNKKLEELNENVEDIKESLELSKKVVDSNN